KSQQLGPNEFAEELTRGAIRIAMAKAENESTNPQFRVGDRVRRSDGLTGVATQNGEVILNNACLVQMVSDEDLKAVGYCAEIMQDSAQLVKVRWHHPTDGYVICTSWCSPSQLEKIGGETPEYLKTAHAALVESDEEDSKEVLPVVEPSP